MLLLAAWAGTHAAGASLLAPEAFRPMANSSVQVLRTQREYLRDFADGQSEGLAFDNLLKVLHFSLARSYDDPRALQQMPLRGTPV